MKLSQPSAVALFLVLAGASGAEDGGAADPHTWELDPKKSELVVRVWKAGIASGVAHNHVVRASDVTGQLTFDPRLPERAQATVTVQTATLIADEPALRKKYGETAEISASDQKKVAMNMFDEGQLDVKRYPVIRFVSTGAQNNSQGRLVLSGQLSLHGVVKVVTLPVTIAVMEDGAVVGDGTLRFRVSDFGIKPYSTALGTIKNRDEVELILHLVGSR